MNYKAKVMEFHELFNHPIKMDNGKSIDEKTAKLRIALLLEELEELSVALNQEKYFKELCQQKINTELKADAVDIKETADALADLQYVLSGAVLALGFTDSFDDIFEEVHGSNMSKLCTDMQQVEDTIKWYIEEKGIDKDDITYKEKNVLTSDRMPNNSNYKQYGFGVYPSNDISDAEQYNIISKYYYIIIRKSDSKILKNKYYNEANIDRYL